MMSTGLSLSEGIDVLKKETKNPLMAKVLGDMSYSLEQGQQLSIIFERYPDVFEPYFLTLIKAGEVSGKLADVFRYLEAELRAEYSLNSKVKGALLYPGIVFSAMIGIGILMFFFVLPQIGKVFLNLKMPLPAFTKTMFTFSITLSNYMVQIILTIFVLGVLLVLSLRNRVVRDALFSLVRPVPVIRNLLVKIDLARFSRIFSTLIKSAVPITEALEIALSTLSLAQLRAQAKVFPDEIKRGKSLSLVIKESKLFPSLLIQMVTAGEKTAMLDTTLADLATFYEEEVEEEVKSLTQIIEPVLMLGVGVAVGVMILSIIAPIYSVVGNFQQAAGAR
jgi:type II secretory pathway component PulF